MILSNAGFDSNSTYFEHNLSSSKIPTFFIHGVGLDNTMWQPQKKYFYNENIVFYDLLNHGKSKKGYKNLKFDDFNNQLIKLINFLNIKKFNLIGFSLGSLIAQHFASSYYKKINKLIIIASVYKRSKLQIEKVQHRYKMALKGIDIANDSINRWFNYEYLKSNPQVYSFFYEILKRKKINDFLAAYKLFTESDNYDINFSNIKIPTFIITGQDEVGSTPKMSKMLNKEINNSKIYIVPKAKHMAAYEKSNLVNKKIYNFLIQSN